MSHDAIEDLSMRDLVKLFKKQVSLHGIARFVPLLSDGEINAEGFDVVSGDRDNDSSGEDSDIDDSVDDISKDSFSDEGNEADDILDSDSGDEDIFSDRDQSEEGSVVDNVINAYGDVDTIHLHDPPNFITLHCPPFISIERTLHGECDCHDFGMDTCGQEDDFQFFETLKLGEEIIEALNTVDCIDRIKSNLLRKRLYRMLFHATDFGILEKKERRKLPNCFVAKIRQIYPSTTGDYMGFKEN